MKMADSKPAVAAQKTRASLAAQASISLKLEPEQVATWLAQHPDFFIERESLLAQMQLQHPCGTAESLLLYQLRILRTQLAQLQAELSQLKHNAQANETKLNKVEALLIQLLTASSQEQMLNRLASGLAAEFAIPWVRLWNYGSVSTKVAAVCSGLQIEAQQALMAHKNSRSLELDTATASLLGVAEAAQGSAVISYLGVRQAEAGSIEVGQKLGLLVLAHPASQHFGQQDTLFVEYLAAILSVLLHKNKQ